MSFVKSTIIRNMARKAIRVEDVRLRNTISKKKVMASEKILKQTSRISAGEKEIVITPTKKTFHTHHDEKSISTFHSFHIRNDVLDGLDKMSIAHPTIIQILGIPHVLNGKNVFCAAQTGSGKTLVYTVPIINSLRQQFDDGYIGRLSRPRALIIAPARELASQILKNFKAFTYTSPFRSVGLIGQKQKKWTRDYLKGVVDVVIGTPNTILKYHKRGHLLLSDLQYLVVDEADTLMDESFQENTNAILQLCQFTEASLGSIKKPVQCVLTAATLPKKGVLSCYKEYIPNLELLQSNLHKVLPNVKHTFIKTTQQLKAELALAQVKLFLSKYNRNKCILFCNTAKSCNWISVLLTQKNINHSKMHGDMRPQTRFEDYDRFYSNEKQILVCTDIASRGLDLSEVSLVINVDCPFNTTDYIHRSGRTGRAATQLYENRYGGEVVTYVTQNKEVIFAQKVQEAASKNEALENITAKRNSAKVKHELEVKKVLTHPSNMK